MVDREFQVARTPAAIRFLDIVSELIIYLSIVFSAWAFAVVHPIPIRAMNVLCIGLGLCFIGKKWVGWRCRFQPLRWDRDSLGRTELGRDVEGYRTIWLWRGVATLGALVLVYVVVHAVNARADFDPTTLTFHYRDGSVSWLPHSYNQSGTLAILPKYTSLFIFFWGLRDWLLVPERSERSKQNSVRVRGAVALNTVVGRMPNRLRRLLFVITINAAAVCAVSILQRLGPNTKLLWVLDPQFKNPLSHFGPFAYRGNAASYFNLAWPICLYFLIRLRAEARFKPGSVRVGQSSHVGLYPVLIAFASVPVVAGSRGGSIVLIITFFLTSLWFFLRSRKKIVAVVCSGLVGFSILTSVLLIDSSAIRQRINLTMGDNWTVKGFDRWQIYENVGRIIQSHLLWGTGPGTFSSVYFMNRRPRIGHWTNTKVEAWSAWAHSDPLEFLLGFGVFGGALLLGGFLILLYIPIAQQGLNAIRGPTGVLYIGLFGFCLHSCVDFPFQVYGLLHFFVVAVAIVTTVEVLGVPALSVNESGQARR